MNPRPKILLLAPHLGGGGAERVIALLAQRLCQEKYELHLGLAAQAAAPKDGFCPGVTPHLLGARRVRNASLKIVALVRQLRPKVILSGMFHLNFLVLMLRPLFPRPITVLVRQNGTVSSALASGDLPDYYRLLYRVLYRRADRILCQSQAMADDLSRELHIGAHRLTVLPNPIDIEGIRSIIKDHAGKRWSTGPGPHLLAVGRLSSEKGFDLLLEALAIVRCRFPGADLAIAGTGREETALRAQCKALGLHAVVHFLGHVPQPAVCFSSATIFVLSSRHEGMPNALLEAAAGGLPLVATPACEGIVDLLRDQPGAWMATAASAEALAACLLTAFESLHPGERFSHEFIASFGLESAIGAYAKLIDAELEACQRDEILL